LAKEIPKLMNFDVVTSLEVKGLFYVMDNVALNMKHSIELKKFITLCVWPFLPNTTSNKYLLLQFKV